MRDLRPEEIVVLQRAFVSLDAALFVAACVLSMLTRQLRARLRADWLGKLPVRWRVPALGAALAVGLLGASWVLYRALQANHFPAELADSLSPDLSRPLLIATCVALPAMGGALRLLGSRTPIWLRLACEALLVPCAYLIGLAISYLSLSLTDLEPWAGFKRAVFFSAAVFALPVALIPGTFRARGLPFVLGVLLLLVFGDLIYLRYFGNILPVLAIGGGGQIWDVRDIIIKYTRGADAFLILVIASSAALAWLWPKAPKAGAPRGLRGALDALLVCTSIVFLLPISGLVQTWMDSDRSWRVLNGTDAVQDSGIVVAHIKEIARSLRDARQHGSITDAEFGKLRAYHEARARSLRMTPTSASRAARICSFYRSKPCKNGSSMHTLAANR